MESDRFDTTPKVRSKPRLNVLPVNPEATGNKDTQGEEVVGRGRFPSWLHRKLPKGSSLMETSQAITGNRLHTVCEEARCPNLLECWSKKTATFLIMGKECTRSCGFCSIDFSKAPKPLEDDEPERVADSVAQLGLKHVVITMVARDDLSDGGAEHLVKVMAAIRMRTPATTIEVLTSDFAGNHAAWDIILNAEPEVFNYNIETVRELTPRVRHTATYERTLELIRYAKDNRKNAKMLVKSGLMVGLGETEEQVNQTIRDLKSSGCDIITIGQYLQPNSQKLLVKAFINPEQFQRYEAYGRAIGVPRMYCGPFVRSSYHAADIAT